MLRGGASRAMCGIPPVRDSIIRPIIYIPKSDIVASLQENAIDFVFDSTNKDTSYTRNYIREEIIPKCARVNSSFEGAIQRMNKNMRADLDFIEGYVDDVCAEKGIKASAKKDDLKGLHNAVLSRVIIHMYSCVSDAKDSLSFSHIEKIIEIINSEDNIGKVYCLPNEIYFSSDRKLFKFEKRADKKENGEFFLELKMGENPLTDLDSLIYLTKEENDEKAKQLKNVYKLSIRANLSSAKIDGSLYVRNKRDGDSYRYGNMTHKLKKLFNDRKLSEKEKRTIPLLCDAQGILWVPGFSVRDENNREKNKDFNLYAYYYSNGGKDE
jgi:tRNA(Ile)-lysidine synthase